MTQDLIRHAALTETARCLLGIMGDLIFAPVSQLAEQLQVERRTVFAAIAELASAGIITRSSERGRDGYVTLALTADAPDRLRALCYHLRVSDGPPGAEYTHVADPEKAAEDRARLMRSTAWKLRTRWAR